MGDKRFVTGDFAFVTPKKGKELKSNIARPGDIIVTQRGTLGQVAIIHNNSIHPEYIISQSQMKITIDETKASSNFIYYYLRSPIGQWYLTENPIQAGVPHINP